MLFKDVKGEIRKRFAFLPHRCWCGTIIWLQMSEKENHGYNASPHWWWNCPEHTTSK